MSAVASKRMRRLGGYGFIVTLAPLGVVDPSLEKLAKFRRTPSSKHGKNAARDLARYVHRDKKVWPVTISRTSFPIVVKKPNKSGHKIQVEKTVPYPIIKLSSWMESILSGCPQFFLAGHTLHDQDIYGDMLESFWASHADLEPLHPIHAKPREFRRQCVPISLHGDEGRGLNKVPLLVVAFQVVIPHNGENALNIKKRPCSKNMFALRAQAFVYHSTIVLSDAFNMVRCERCQH